MTKTKITEAHIRDHIADHLDLIEPGLVLTKTELHLRNHQGASGYLDIFAHDAVGKLVIIEIKRTDVAAREAIQELYKYVPLLRENFLAKNTDIRLILLSVEWHELGTPYAEFAAWTPFDVTAGKIILDLDGTPLAIEPIAPLLLTNERKIGVRHFLWGFPDEAAATKAVKKIAQRVERFGLADFLLVQSRPTQPAFAGRSFLYFAQRELRFEEYMSLIESNFNEDQLKEFLEQIADLTELEDRVAEASDAVWDIDNGVPGRDIGADTVEIAYPERGNKWFEDGAQENIVVHRYGRFENPWLEDQTLIKEIRGEGGESDIRLCFIAQTDSPPQMVALHERIENIFFFNNAWLGAVMQLIRYAERKDEPVRIELRAYNPDDILRAVAASAAGFQGYNPTFILDIEHNGEVERFVGIPEWDGTSPDFSKLIAKHFSNDSFQYFMACHFSKIRQMNSDIMMDLGLHYIVFREGDDGRERIRVQGASIMPIKGAIHSMNTMITEHHEEVYKLVDIFMTHDEGFAEIMHTFINSYDQHIAESQLKKMIEGEIAPIKEKYWNGDITDCDRCGQQFAPMRFMIDAILHRGIGVNLCAQCFLQIGRGIGTGRGQVYEASEKGWRYIAG